MPAIEIHTFRKVNCVDQLKKCVLPSGAINLKLTSYSDEEFKDLSIDYRNITFDNIMTEFEFITEIDYSGKKLELNKLYQFKIFEKNYMEGTDFFGTMLELLRTEKLKNNKNRYHYYGVRTIAQTFDQLELFSNYKTKIFVIVGKEKTLIKKVFTNEQEEELKEFYPVSDYDLYDINKYLEKHNKTHRDGALIEMQPDLI
jgi:uncharacterized protein (DUF433 family)